MCRVYYFGISTINCIEARLWNSRAFVYCVERALSGLDGPNGIYSCQISQIYRMDACMMGRLYFPNYDAWICGLIRKFQVKRTSDKRTISYSTLLWKYFEIVQPPSVRFSIQNLNRRHNEMWHCLCDFSEIFTWMNVGYMTFGMRLHRGLDTINGMVQ